MQLTSKNFTEQASFFGALGVGLIVLIAAFGKLFFPSDLLVTFDRVIALFEIIMISSLVLFYDAWRSWALIAPVFILWAGYSLFWMLWGLPCGCLGKLVHLPSGVTFSVDLIFFITALVLAKLLNRQANLRQPLLASLIAAPIGFLIAFAMYRYLSYFVNYVAD